MSLKNLKIAIAEPNEIVRLGIEAFLKKLPGYKIQVMDVSDSSKDILEQLPDYGVDIMLLNPIISGMTLRKEYRLNGEMGVVAMLTYPVDTESLSGYNEYLSLADSSEKYQEVFDKILSIDKSGSDSEECSLTAREKEVVVCVVKGMTNKQIAEALFLSTHTVITHRRNIAKKLQIHSTSGLTIYAIVNKLVELDEITK